jgi:hypothetical protein
MTRVDATVAKYLEKYAEPEARLRFAIEKSYRHVLVVPAFREAPSLLDGMRAALEAQPSLLILVVNATSDVDSAGHAQNQVLVSHLLKLASTQKNLHEVPPIELLETQTFDILLLDRASAGFRLPHGEGVGLARKIGCDVALALKAQGLLNGCGFGCSDADVQLPAHYFSNGETGIIDASAAIFPFTHRSHGDPRVTAATLAYELSLRYYVLGLAHADSAYAYHSLGSTLYLDFAAYAQVRGFPKRQAGEDFYLLNKLSKLGRLRRLKSPFIGIQSRESNRVPFGTGPGVKRLMLQAEQGKEPSLYHPRCFSVLREVLACFAEFSSERDLVAAQRRLTLLPEAPAVLEYLERVDFGYVLAAAAEQARSPAQLQRRLNTWFDALKTLKLIHALEPYHPMLSWHEALNHAPFMPHGMPSLKAALRAAEQEEQTLSEFVGVATGSTGA